jgi:acetylornithine deacetylase/succinyl-diaminopimelate desuccinylase-like protein
MKYSGPSRLIGRTVSLLGICVATVPGRGVLAQSSADATVRRVQTNAAFRAAAADIDQHHDRLVADIVSITEIPAPPFKEDARGNAYLALLKQTSLIDITRDAAGNVMGLRKGTGGGALIAIAAHLDTVFPAGTDVHVKRQGTRLSAPGIGDDSRSLAVLLAIIRAMDATHVKTTSDILFVADVGEEGAGDLRGMKELFLKGPYKGRIKTFITLDDSAPGSEVTNGAVGSQRYRVTFKGPGGHSYGAFGLVNPAFAMGNAISKFSGMTVPATPGTTFNVGTVTGGTSVNSIPEQVSMDVDMRSESPIELTKLVGTFKTLMRRAADEENAARSTTNGRVTVTLDLIGDRPSGETPAASPLVETASAAIRAMGMTPQLGYASTDANIPISLGIPAIRINSGGTGGGMHSPAEWIDVEKTASVKGIDSALLLLLSLAGAA